MTTPLIAAAFFGRFLVLTRRFLVSHGYFRFLFKPVRQQIEIAFRQITRLFPRHIHAVTAKGFVLKIICLRLSA